MTLIYQLLRQSERIAHWDDLQTAVVEGHAYLADHPDDVDALRLVGMFTSYQHGATAAFTIAGKDIAPYLAAAATVIASGDEADDTAAVVGDLPSEQRQALLDLLRPNERRRVQALLEHARPLAGELIRPGFLCFYEDQTVGHVTERLQKSSLRDEAVAKIFIVNSHQRLVGACTLRDLMRARPETLLRELTTPTPFVRRTARLGELATLMAEHDTTIVPVIDDTERPAGIITVDDVLELMLPSRWAKSPL